MAGPSSAADRPRLHHRAIEEELEPAATGLDGLRVVQVTVAMIASARDKRTIRLELLVV